MQVQLFDSLDALWSIETHWIDLYARCPGVAPFQHPAWLLSWWDIFQNGRLFTFGVWRDGRLTALLPTFLHVWNGRRQITFLGNGASDRLDVLAASPGAEDAAQELVNELVSRRSEWDVISLEDVPAGSLLARFCEGSPALADIQARVLPNEICAVRPLPESPESLHASLPHGLRRNLRRYLDKLKSAGRVDLHSADSERTFEFYLDALFRLHAARWNQRGESGMLDGWMESFHRLAARRMWQLGKARLFALLLNERPIAVIYGFVDKNRFWSYQCGFDPDMAQYSPGALILNFAMQRVIGERCTVYDFLRGSDAYKQDWGAEFTRNLRLVLSHRQAVDSTHNEFSL